MNTLIDNPEAMASGYLAMAQMFSYPDADAWPRLTESGLVDPAFSRETLEAEYLALFEMGGGSSTVSLYEGQNRPDHGRDGILQELLRYYEFFNAHLNQDEREYPDHLVTELEFLAWLCLQEHAAVRDGRDAEPFRNAARDFLTRHLAAWLPDFRRRLEATNTTYALYGPVLGELVKVHRNRLGEQAQEPGVMQ
jgi:DMSO reductase family type II enzyme chaperone